MGKPDYENIYQATLPDGEKTVRFDLGSIQNGTALTAYVLNHLLNDPDYFVEQMEIRKKEIEEGKNALTACPVYVVYDSCANLAMGHQDWPLTTSKLDGREDRWGLLVRDNAGEFAEFIVEDELFPDESYYEEANRILENYQDTYEVLDDWDIEEATEFYVDRFVAVFLTSEAAHEYIDRQRHNMEKPFVFVEYAGYGNNHFEQIFGR